MTEPTTPQPPERAFCHATGFVYQFVGFVLALGTCCWWSMAGRFEKAPEVIKVQGTESVALGDVAPTAAKSWAMIGVCTSFAGGLGLVALGIGLQHDLTRTGRAAKWVTGLIAAFFWAYLGCAIVMFPQAGRIITAGLMAVFWLAMYLLAGASAEQLKKFPPAKRDSSWSSRDEDALRKSVSPLPPDETNP